MLCSKIFKITQIELVYQLFYFLLRSTSGNISFHHFNCLFYFLGGGGDFVMLINILTHTHNRIFKQSVIKFMDVFSTSYSK